MRNVLSFFVAIALLLAITAPKAEAKLSTSEVGFVFEVLPSYLTSAPVAASAMEGSDKCDPCPSGYTTIPPQADYGVHAYLSPWEERCWIQYVMDCDEAYRRLITSISDFVCETSLECPNCFELECVLQKFLDYAARVLEIRVKYFDCVKNYPES